MSGLVIVLIAAEILVAAINIIVDLYAGVEYCIKLRSRVHGCRNIHLAGQNTFLGFVWACAYHYFGLV
jgi:hypothetical protein